MNGHSLKKLVGKKINKIFFNKQVLRFETDNGNYTFWVYGDCCSESEFWDFYGVKNLLNNGNIKDVKEVELLEGDTRRPDGDNYSTQYYGYQITTESPEFGEVTSVFSFRNVSNGYYGGNLKDLDSRKEVEPEIFDDVIEAQEV